MKTGNSSNVPVDQSDLNVIDVDETTIVVENEHKEKPRENEHKQKPTAIGCSKHTVAIPAQENDGKNDGDHAVVISENVSNKTIEVDGDSAEESELSLRHKDVDPPNMVNDSITKATEFVIVNAKNVVMDAALDQAEINRYTMADIQIKDELAETFTADLNSNDILENDPMDLLELNERSECTSTTRSQDDTEDYGDDLSSIGSSSVQTGSTASTSAFDWIKGYAWLLFEEGGQQFGSCLYCDTKINIKSQRSVKQHGLSLYHKERCENYLAFCEEEEKNGLSMDLFEIKEEFGTESSVEALRLKRKSQSAALNNFNWRRWLKECSWLERGSTEGAVGYCKYCRIYVNVEFSYLRIRHQEGSKHKDAEKHYDESKMSIHHQDGSKRKEAEKQYEESTNSPEFDEQSNTPEIYAERGNDSATDSANQLNNWLEVLKNEPTMVRCKICMTKMIKSNFPRHLRTNLHEHNEKIFLETQNSKNKHKNWTLYAKQHPWLIPDPTDNKYAFCKYCEKRIMYGLSAAKRAVHENSSQHKLKERAIQKSNRRVNTDDKGHSGNSIDKHVVQNYDMDVDEEDENTNDDEGDQDQNEEEEVDNDETNEGEEDEDEETNQEDGDVEEKNQQVKECKDENDTKKRIYRLTEEWINQYSWCKRYNKDPTNFFFCIYCKIPLVLSNSRSKHQSTSVHIAAEKEFLKRQAKRQKLQERKQNNESFYEWAIPLRNNPSSYSCRYCRVRISKNYSKKHHASSKIHQINENIYKTSRRKSLRKDDNDNSENSLSTKIVTQLANGSSTKREQTFAKVVIKAPSTISLIKQWQKRFPWLSYKRNELRSHYGHCKVCDSSLFIRSLKHVLRHVRSSRHLKMIKAKKKEKVENDSEELADQASIEVLKKGPKEELQTTPPPNDESKKTAKLHVPTSTKPIADSPKAYNYKSTITEMKKRFSWIEDSERENYASCRFCNTSIPLKILFLRNHTKSQKHREAVINYSSNNEPKINRSKNVGKSDNDEKSDDDVMIVEENNEEILISEQDENWTVKSETMDEHEQLDYLLQRSYSSQNNSHSQRNIRKGLSLAEDDPPTKRTKRSQSFRRLNDNNASLVASLLTTPLTLASCLSPLIQQQIQQQANISQSTNANTPTSTLSLASMSGQENTYDLFFKSISETVKKLPVDLAAEGKLRVMQIICDLELQALKRQQNVGSENPSYNTSGNLSFQPTSTSTCAQPSTNTSTVNNMSLEQNCTDNETVITQLNTSTEVSAASVNPNLPLVPSNTGKACTSNTSSPIIGVMDKNGLQTIHFKTSVAKQIPRSTNNTNVTTVATSGIRCIPFKNLSQSGIPDAVTTNAKVARIQVPLNVTTQTSTTNTNGVNNNTNLINFRNIQITKRINTPTTPVSSSTSVSGTTQKQTISQTSSVINKSPQKTYIANLQPQLQRWGCSVNSSTTTPTTTTVKQFQLLPSQQTSTPISKNT